MLAFLRPLPTMLETDELCCGANMPTHVNPPPATDEQVRALLEKYKCPVPFHEVRTRFLASLVDCPRLGRTMRGSSRSTQSGLSRPSSDLQTRLNLALARA